MRAASTAVRTNLHIYPSPIEFESRMFRETQSLVEEGLFDAIELVGTGRDGLPAVERLDAERQVVRIPLPNVPGPRPLSRALGLWGWAKAVERQYRGRALACINAHSLTVLPLAVRLARSSGARLVYDTHELETETAAASGPRKWMARRLERRLISHVDHTFVVSDGIEAWYRQRYGLEAITTIKNYPAQSRARRGGSSRLRERLGLPKNTQVFLYLGVFSPGRGLDVLLDAFSCVGRPDQHLVCMGYGPLRSRLDAAAETSPHIHVLDAVPPEEVLEYAAGADVGLALIEPVSLSYRHCLPNKLLESLASGIPPLVSPLPDMVAEIEGGRLGWAIEPDAGAVASWLGALTTEAIHDKRQHLEGWAKNHSWEGQAEQMLAAYNAMGFS